MIIETASTPCHGPVPPSPRPSRIPLDQAPCGQGKDGAVSSSRLGSTGPELGRSLAELFPPLSSLDEPSRLEVYSLYLDALVKSHGQRQQKGQLCHAEQGQDTTASVAAAAAVLSSMSTEELLGSLPKQLDWQLMLKDIQVPSGKITLTALKLMGLLLQAPSAAQLHSDAYYQELLQVVKESMQRDASKERCKLAIWVVQTQQLPAGRLSGHGASLLGALEVCLPLDNPWHSPMISLQALLAVQRLLAQLPDEATHRAGSWAPAVWPLMLATGFEGSTEARAKAAAYRQIREGAVVLTRQLGAALAAYRRGELIQGGVSADGHRIAATVTSHVATSGGCGAVVRTSQEDKAAAAAAAEAELVGRQLGSRLMSSMLSEMVQMVGRVTTLPRGTEPPDAAVEAAVAAVATWGAAVLVLGPSFVRVNCLGQKMLDTVRPCFTCTSNTQLPCAAFAAWRDLFDTFREIGEVPPPPPPQRFWCSSGGGGGSRSLSRLRLMVAPIEHTAKHDKRPEVLQAALLCWQYLVQLLTRSYGHDATLYGSSVAGPVATAVATLEDAVELRLPLPFHTTGRDPGHQGPGQLRRPPQGRPAGAMLPDVWSWAVAPVAKAVLHKLATGPSTPKAAAAGASGGRMPSHQTAEVELVLVNLIDTTCTANVGLLAQTLLHALPSCSGSGSGGGGCGSTPSGKESLPGSEAAAGAAAAASAAIAAAATVGTAICSTAGHWAALLKRMFRCAAELTAAEAMQTDACLLPLSSATSGCQPLARGSSGLQGLEAEPSATAATGSASAPVEGAWQAWGSAAERVWSLLLAASLSPCKDELTAAPTIGINSRSGHGEDDDDGGNKAWILWLHFCFTVPGLLNPIPDAAHTVLQPPAPAQTLQQQPQQQSLQLLEQREALRRLLCRYAGPQLTRLLMRLLVPYTPPGVLGPGDRSDGAVSGRSRGLNSSSLAVLVETVTAWLTVSRALHPLAGAVAPPAGDPDVAATTITYPEWWGDWRSHLRSLLMRSMYACGSGEPGGGGCTAAQCLAALCCPALRPQQRIRSGGGGADAGFREGSRPRGRSPSPMKGGPRSPLSPAQRAAAQQQDAQGQEHYRAGCQAAATNNPSCNHWLPCPYAWVLWETAASLLTERPSKEAAMKGPPDGRAGPLVVGPLIPEEGSQGANRRRREAADAVAKLLIAPLEGLLLPGTAAEAVPVIAAEAEGFGDGRRMATAWVGLLSASLQHSRRTLYGIASAGRVTGRPDAVVVAVHGVAARFMELLRVHGDTAVAAEAVARPPGAPAWRFLGITGAALARHLAAMSDASSVITGAAFTTVNSTAAAQDGGRSRTRSTPTSFSGGDGGGNTTPMKGNVAPTTPFFSTPGRGTAPAAAALTPRGARGGVDPVGATASAAASLTAANALTPGGMSPSLSRHMVSAEAAALTAPALGPKLLAALASAAVSALVQSRRPAGIAGSERATGVGNTSVLSVHDTEQLVHTTLKSGLCPDAPSSGAALQRPSIALTAQHQQHYQLQSCAAEALAEALDAIPDVLLALEVPLPGARQAVGADAAAATSVATATATATATAVDALQALQAPLVILARDLLPHVLRQHGTAAAAVSAADTTADSPSVGGDSSGGITTCKFGVAHAATAMTAMVGLLCQLRQRGYDVTAQLDAVAPLLVACLRLNRLIQPAGEDGAQQTSRGGLADAAVGAAAVVAEAEAEASVLSQATAMALESLLAGRMPRLHNRVAEHLRRLMLREQQVAIARTVYRNPRESTSPSPGSCSIASASTAAVSGPHQLLVGNAAGAAALARMAAHAAPVTVGNLTPLALPQALQLAIDGLAWDGAFLLPDSQLQTAALPNRLYTLQPQQHPAPMVSPVSQPPQRQLDQQAPAPISVHVGTLDREVSAKVFTAGRRSDIRSGGGGIGGNAKRSFQESQTEYVHIAPSPSPARQTAAGGAAAPHSRASKRRRRYTGLTTYTALDGSQTGLVGLIGMGSESQGWSSDDDMVADRGGADGNDGPGVNGPHLSSVINHGDNRGGNGANRGDGGNGSGPAPHPWEVVSSRPPGAGPQSSAEQRRGPSGPPPLADRTRSLADGGIASTAVRSDNEADGSAAPQAAVPGALLHQPNAGSYAPVQSDNGPTSSVTDPTLEGLPSLLSRGVAKPAPHLPRLGGALDQRALVPAPEPPPPRCPSPVPDPALDQLPPSHLRQRRSSAPSGAQIMTRSEPSASPSSARQPSPTPPPPPSTLPVPQQQAVQNEKQRGQGGKGEGAGASGKEIEVDIASRSGAGAATEDVEMVPDSLDPHIPHPEHECLQVLGNADVVRPGEARMTDATAAAIAGTEIREYDDQGHGGADRSGSGSGSVAQQLTAGGETSSISISRVNGLPDTATLPNGDNGGSRGVNGGIAEVIASAGGDVCAVAVVAAPTGDSGIPGSAAASAAAAAAPTSDVDVDQGAARAGDQAPLMDGASQLDLAESYDIRCGVTAAHGARCQRLLRVSDQARSVLAQSQAPPPLPVSPLLLQQQQQRQAGRVAVAAATATQPKRAMYAAVPAATPMSVGTPATVATVDGVDELFVESTQQQQPEPVADGRRMLGRGLGLGAITPAKAPCAVTDLVAGCSNTSIPGRIAPSEPPTKQPRCTGAQVSELAHVNENHDEVAPPAGLPLRRLRNRTASHEKHGPEGFEGGGVADSITAVVPLSASAVISAVVAASASTTPIPTPIATTSDAAPPVPDARVAGHDVAASETYQGGALSGMGEAEANNVLAPAAPDAVHQQSQGRLPGEHQANRPMRMHMRSEAEAPGVTSGERGSDGAAQAGQLVGMRHEADFSAAVPPKQAGPGSSVAAEAVAELRRSLTTMHVALEDMDACLLLETGAMLSDMMSRVHMAMVRLRQQPQQARTLACDGVGGVGV
ncbi:hypothetical protein VaNZ11_003488 [Volvox africanus]|uniref:Telomere-associated protein Rif1 N-terminal domain-containing protein n=1 Tax=Volvox africanus TaxID=51714 RepID=A0ABQ5RVG3_9CHLO|nr:hypothetical protein VaNZ11_003488 [Volvox africanus]